MGRRLAAIAALILLAATVTAAQPTQSYSKTYLSPFYTLSMAGSTNYTYTVEVDPPDGISRVTSAIITLDIWLNPTVTFTAFVDGQPCSNPDYTVSTTYAGAGQGRAYFDCTNRIRGRGNYTVKLASSRTTGASNLWLDIAYYNNPKGDIEIWGTEYSPGDPATLFLQLKDAQGIPVQNAQCSLDIFKPLSNGTHAYLLDKAPMIFQNISNSGDDGIYYYDLIAPSTLGVYMVTAACSYSFGTIWVHPPNSAQNSTFSAATGTWTGGTFALNSMDDGLYQKCTYSGGAGCLANYTFNLSQYSLGNFTGINLYWSGQSDKTPNMTFYYWNGGGFVQLPNSQTLSATATSSTTPSTIDEFITNRVPTGAVINDTITIRTSAQLGGTVFLYTNWLSLTFNSPSGLVSDLKGGSEMHITNVPSATYNLTIPDFSDIKGNLTALGANVSSVNDSIIRLNNTLMSVNATSSGRFDQLLAAILSANSTIHWRMANNFTALQLIANSTNSTIHLAIASSKSGVIEAVFHANGSIQSAMATNASAIINNQASANNSVHAALGQNYSAIELQFQGTASALAVLNASLHSAIAGNASGIIFAITGANGSVLSSMAVNSSNIIDAINNVNATIGNISLNLTPAINAIVYANNTILSQMAINSSGAITATVNANNSIHGAMASNFTEVGALLNAAHASVIAAITTNTSGAINAISFANGSIQAAQAANTSAILDAITSTNSSINFTTLEQYVQSANSTLHLAILGSASGIIGAIHFANNTMHVAIATNSTASTNQLAALNNSLQAVMAANTTGIIEAAVLANNSLHNAAALNFTTLSSLVSGINGSIQSGMAANASGIILATIAANHSIQAAQAANTSAILAAIGGTNFTAEFNQVLAAIQSANDTLHLAILYNSTGTIEAVAYANGTILTAINTSTPIINFSGLYDAINAANQSVHDTLQSNFSNQLSAIALAEGGIINAVSYANGTILASITNNTAEFNNSLGYVVWTYPDRNVTVTGISANVSALTAAQNSTLYAIHSLTTTIDSKADELLDSLNYLRYLVGVVYKEVTAGISIGGFRIG